MIRPGTGRPGYENLDFGYWPDTLLTICVAALCIGLASQTYRLIEEPGRRWAKRKAKRRGAQGAEATAPTI
jgi:peptidoglycan/LPS O-acetylase OafA/YrhL